jgi:hypothetical protein
MQPRRTDANARATTSANPLYTFSNGALAQLGERRLCKPEVTGSIPVRSIVTVQAETGENPRKSAELPIQRFATVRNGWYLFQPLFPRAVQGRKG